MAVSFYGNSNQNNLYKESKLPSNNCYTLVASCAIITKLGLQDKWVHYSYNNFIDALANL